ncbi:MAG TPA: glycosyltransferase [Candidatus Sulfotelmatobacter sp.]|jgi:glycosyltransferase involved in cell wall biosynthesis
MGTNLPDQPGSHLRSNSTDSTAHSERNFGAKAAGRRKIFFLLDSLNLGGTETQAVELATRLSPKRYEVTFGCLKATGPLRDRLDEHAVAIHEFYPAGGVDSVRGIYQVLRLARFLRAGRFQIVHTHDLYSNLLGIPAALVARVPVIISSQRDLAHFGVYRTGRRRWVRRLQKHSLAVIANANAVRDAILQEADFPAEKIRVIYNGIDASRFERDVRDRSWIAPNAEREKWIVLVGNMHSDIKGHRRLMEAAKEVVRAFPESRFILAGDGALRSDFEAQVAGLGLSKHFLFLGRRDDVPRILSCCDVAVLPSQAEGLPNAILEYLAAGLPTVATRVGGTVEIISDGKNGLLVPAGDSSVLAGALLRLLRDPALAAEVGRNGREFVASRFSFERMIESTDRLYSELLRSRGLE